MSVRIVTIDGYTYEIDLGPIHPGESRLQVLVDGEPVEVIIPDPESTWGEMARFIVDGRPYEVRYDPNSQWIRSHWGLHQVEVHDMESAAPRPATGDGRVKAPIPGRVTRVLVETGVEVSAGQPLLVLEAMKMENEIRAARAGTVETLNVRPGQTVALHQVLVEIV